MSIFIPVLLCMAVMGAALFTWKKPVRTGATGENAEQADIPALLAEVRARRDRLVADAVANGLAFPGERVGLTCECGSSMQFSEFRKSKSVVADRSLFLDHYNLVFHHADHGYRGPSDAGRKVGEGLGWVGTDLGCPACQSRKFRFDVFEMNAYTTCGDHLVRRDQLTCPICEAHHAAAREEMQLHARLSPSRRVG